MPWIDGNKNRRVVATVVSQSGECEIGHEVGDQAVFKLEGIEGKICMHALYSMIPKVLALYYKAQFPLLAKGGKMLHACPDGANPVIFEFEVLD